MRPLVLTPKFKRAFRQQRIEETLQQMEADVFTPNLGTHKLGGKFSGLQACSCGYDCREARSICLCYSFEENFLGKESIGSYSLNALMIFMKSLLNHRMRQ
jgi:mRNA interferase YafQ